MSIFGELLALAYEQRVPLALACTALVAIGTVIAWRAGLFSTARRHPGRATALIGAALVVGTPVAWYLGSPIFIRTELVEAPVAADVATVPAVTHAPSADIAPTPSRVSGSSPGAAQRSPSAAPATPAPWTLSPRRSGTFRGTDEFHFGRGTATIVETAPGAWSIRFEDFSVRNGPDLYVYLSPDPDGYARGALEVARLKATDGSFNQRLPKGSDPARHRSVLIWCKQFSHLFAVATLRDEA